MADISKQTSDKLAITRALVSAAETHVDKVVARLEPLFFPDGVPAQLTLRDVFLAPVRYFERLYQDLARLDQLAAQEKGDDEEVRSARNALIAGLRMHSEQVRQVFATIYGDAVAKSFGMNSAAPPMADDLIPYAAHILETLSKKGVPSAPEGSAFKGVDFTGALTQLKALLAELDANMTTLARETRETQSAVADRNAADAAWTRNYSPTAHWIESLLVFALFDALAERVRPTARRRAGRPEPTDMELQAPSDSGDPTSPASGDPTSPSTINSATPSPAAGQAPSNS